MNKQSSGNITRKIEVNLHHMEILQNCTLKEKYCYCVQEEGVGDSVFLGRYFKIWDWNWSMRLNYCIEIVKERNRRACMDLGINEEQFGLVIDRVFKFMVGQKYRRTNYKIDWDMMWQCEVNLENKRQYEIEIEHSLEMHLEQLKSIGISLEPSTRRKYDLWPLKIGYEPDAIAKYENGTVVDAPVELKISMSNVRQKWVQMNNYCGFCNSEVGLMIFYGLGIFHFYFDRKEFEKVGKFVRGNQDWLGKLMIIDVVTP